MVHTFDLRHDAERHIYSTCRNHIKDGDVDALYYLVTDNTRNFVAESLIEIEDLLRIHRCVQNQPFDAYSAFAYGTDLPYAERQLDLHEDLTLDVVQLSTATLEEAARAYDALQTVPDAPLETLGDVLHLVEHRFQFDFMTEVLFIEDEEEGEYHIVASESDAAEWLERHARDANLSDEAIASGYWIHRIRRGAGVSRKLWRVVKKRPHVSRRIDVLF